MYELGDGLVLRAARAEDVPGIVALLLDDPVEADRPTSTETADDRYAENFAAVDSDPRHELVVVTRPGDDRVLATAHLVVIPGLSWRGALRAQLQGVRVVADMRGKGVGSQLLRWVLDRARVRDCEVVQVVSDKRRHDAHRFYVGWGFRASHEGLKLRLGE